MSLLDSIKEHEGFSKTVYNDSLNIPTIGYGFAIKDLELSEEICEKILLEKLQDLIVRVGKKFPWWSKASEPIRDVVVELCYQLGVTGFSRFKKTIDHLENRRYAKAATEMLDSKWARSDSPKRALAMSKIVKEQE